MGRGHKKLYIGDIILIYNIKFSMYTVICLKIIIDVYFLGAFRIHTL